MSRTLSAGMAAHLAQTSHSRCNMLLLVLQDGTKIGVTDHNRNLDYDVLGTGSVAYSSGTGILSSNISTACGLSADNYEVTGPVGDTFDLDGILGGKFNRARAYRFQVNWKDTTQGAIKLLAGTVSEARIEGGRFVMEIRSDMDFYNQSVGRVIENQCNADFGDTRCGATPTTVTGTVTAATDALHITVSFTGSYADDFFNKGTLIGLTGANAGTTVEIYDWTSAGAVTLFAPLVEVPAIGDTFTVKDGCSKLRKSDTAGVPTCLTYNNVINFRGYPEVPGSDQVLRMPIPGGGDQ